MSGYEPGAVAVATVRGVKDVRVMRGAGIFQNHWYSNTPVTGSLTSFSDAEVTDVRPLVVLDPDNREDAVSLARVLDAEFARRGWANDGTPAPDVIDAVHAALRTAARPPEPPEPTGLGAVVKDRSGDRWVWLSAGQPGPFWWRVGTPSKQAFWREIDAIEVLSEGVMQP